MSTPHCFTYTFIYTLAPAGIIADMVEVSVGINLLDVDLIVSYVSICFVAHIRE